MYLKLALVSAMCCAASWATAQSLGYENQKGQSPDYVEEVGPNGRQNDILLDNERLNLPSDLNHRKWSTRLRPFFDSMDLDKDGVLSELDLRPLDQEAVSDWSVKQVEDIMTFWVPAADEHLSKIEAIITKRSEEDEILSGTAEAAKKIKRELDAMQLTDSDIPAFVRISLTGQPEVSRTGYVATDHRAWVEVSVPFDLEIWSVGGEVTYPMVAHVLGMRKFPLHEGDDLFAIWDFSLSSPEG